MHRLTIPSCLLVAACAAPAMVSSTTPLITNISAAFLTDRPGQGSSGRTLGQAASTDMLFLYVVVANPQPAVASAAVVCQRADGAQAPVRDTVVVSPRSTSRVRLAGFMASVFPYRVRCRLESSSASSAWVSVDIPANDSSLAGPM